MDYNSINFKNKDIDRFSTRFGKEGDPIKGSTGSAKETKKNESGVLTTKQNNALNEGIEKQNGEIKYKGTPETKEPKDWRDRSKLGAILHGSPIPHKDNGGKKVTKPSNGRVDIELPHCMDDSCKKMIKQKTGK
jgi:hypothetical protein